jgi:hypothetical protein
MAVLTRKYRIREMTLLGNASVRSANGKLIQDITTSKVEVMAASIVLEM